MIEPIVLEGRVVSLNVSTGGVPKTPVAEAAVTPTGLSGDRQSHPEIHGGLERAVTLFSLEVIERLRLQGHPIAAGTTGENITVAGLDWALLVPGTRLHFEGGVVLEVSRYCSPCPAIRGSFLGEQFQRIRQTLHPGESRLAARVIQDGTLRRGERIRVS